MENFNFIVRTSDGLFSADFIYFSYSTFGVKYQLYCQKGDEIFDIFTFSDEILENERMAFQKKVLDYMAQEAQVAINDRRQNCFLDFTLFGM